MPSSVGSSAETPLWRGLPADYVGDIDLDQADDADINDLLLGMTDIDRGHSYLSYTDYRYAAVLFDHLVATREHTDGYVVDGFADAATRIAQLRTMTRHQAEVLLDEAITLRDRLPNVLECLGDGVITQRQARTIITGTDLIDGQDYAPLVDAQIAARLRAGSYSAQRLRDMVDRIIFRQDPDAVRQRRKDALDRRGVWLDNRRDGTAELTGVMSAENARIAYANIETVAARVCAHDGRTKNQRLSDAEFALLSGSDFTCECGRDDCPITAATLDLDTNPDTDSDGDGERGSAGSTAVVAVAAKVVIHVVTDEATLAGRADNPGYMDGHGVIDGAHVRELAARPDARIAHLIPPGTPMNPDGTFTLPGSLPSDPYRPTTALDTFIRIRHGYCSEPGCGKSAWECDGEHVGEYNHDNPAAGGQTTSENMNPKCRPWHLLKTFGGWLDDMWRDASGRLRTQSITPEGLVIDGEAETLEDLFPGLRRMRFTAPPHAPPPDSSHNPQRPTRTRSRTANKHARRRAERNRNRKRNNEGPPPPF
ncbi:DUF222 domain-containing protein [Gordonia rhizosphera]|uniref:DUF222 domain-containing protein n=1 Tax=Gordonia rhizosphera NBRC 16068 TaxID=1108045 RepID=K6WET3_9ACTN|nr:DUF222 domain-containing protein [Gordonia rhizosphera]GAB90697.1 hypothetical protein GORHZ_115_00510 [Gordonia rhizosphera NBRC 16068]